MGHLEGHPLPITAPMPQKGAVVLFDGGIHHFCFATILYLIPSYVARRMIFIDDTESPHHFMRNPEPPPV